MDCLETLPRTGWGTLPLTLIGVGLIVLGFVLLRRVRPEATTNLLLVVGLVAVSALSLGARPAQAVPARPGGRLVTADAAAPPCPQPPTTVPATGPPTSSGPTTPSTAPATTSTSAPTTTAAGESTTSTESPPVTEPPTTESPTTTSGGGGGGNN